MLTRPLRPVHTPLRPDSIDAFRDTVARALDGGAALLPVGRLADAAAFEPDRGVQPDTAVVIGTSGSTGVAKGVTLPAASLRASATATHERLGGPGDWLLALPVHHIAGLQVLVRSIVAATEVSTVDCTDGFTPQAFIAAASRLRAGRRYAALVPTQLTRLLDAGDAAIRAVASFAAVIVGGAASSTALLDRARAVGVNPVTTYGMSETAGGCLYDGRPLRDVRVDVGVDGAVRLGGPTLATGYLHRPDLTSESFQDGWFHTRDVGRWLPGNRLDVLGRSDDVVNSGGEKIPPILVERALQSRAEVRAACVLGIPDQEWGQVLAAAVVIAGPPDLDRLRAAVRDAIGRHAVPKRFVVLDALPMLDSGKVDRSAVARLLRGD